jgi:hypothetical protein
MAAPTPAVREVAPEDFGRVLLEELLFRAARQICASGQVGGALRVELAFEIQADAAGRALILSCPDALEGRLEMRLAL